MHDGMHVNAESLFVETTDSDVPSSIEEGNGEITVTDLLNFGMPLIRYRMGDFGALSIENCPCGRGLPRLKNIAGRVSDVFYTPDHKKIAAGALVLYLVDEAPGPLGQVQIVQDRIDHLIIRTTRDPSPTEAIRQYQINKVRELFGQSMQVTFEEVQRIERQASGKYSFTICNIPDHEF